MSAPDRWRQLNWRGAGFALMVYGMLMILAGFVTRATGINPWLVVVPLVSMATVIFIAVLFRLGRDRPHP